MSKFIWLLLLLPISLSAQKLALGKVTIAELEQKQHEMYPDAEAAILYSRGVTRFEYSASRGFYTVTEVEAKIKIYKKEGYEWANKIVPYYTGENEDQTVSFSKAATYNLVAGQIQKTKLKSEGEFTERLNKNWSVRKINMPDVREGSIVEYMITFNSPYINTLYDWTFQETIPVDYSEYKTQIPDIFKYNTYWKGFLTPQIEKTSIKRDFAGVSTDTENRVGGYKIVRSNYAFDCQEITTSCKFLNIPAMKDELYVNNIENYTQSVSHELATITYPREPTKFVANDWEAVTKKIYKNPDFGLELDKDGYYSEDFASLGLGSDPEKLMGIYRHVQQRMNWNSRTGYLCDVGVRRAYLDKTGNAAEINLMLVSMLRKAGLDAHPVLLSTRDNGIAIFPNRTAFNYVVASVVTPQGQILLDATEKELEPGMLPVRALNWFGRVISESGRSNQVGLMALSVAKENSTIMATLNADGKASGKMRTQHADYAAYIFRKHFLKVKQESYLEYLEKLYDGVEIEGYEVLGDRTLGKPVTETFSFSGYDAAEKVGSRLYLSPLLFLVQTVNPFKADQRNYPIDFTYPHQQKVTISLAIPQGYEIESVPVASAAAVDDVCDFKYNLSQSGGQIQISCTININQAVVGPDYYDGVKKFYQTLIEKENEKIILKKI